MLEKNRLIIILKTGYVVAFITRSHVSICLSGERNIIKQSNNYFKSYLVIYCTVSLTRFRKVSEIFTRK